MAEENTDTPPVIQETTASSSDKVAEVSAGGDQAAAESCENVTSKSDESTPAIIKRAPKRKSEQPEEEHADDDTEGKIASLEQPLVVEGKRERKKVERLAITPVQESPRDKHELSEGKGDKLGDIARIEFQLGKFHAEDLKPLHRLLFARAGSNNEVKKNIRKFNGFLFDKDSKDYEKKNDQLVKFTIAGLKTLCEVLDLERSGTKEALMDRILGFLLLPKDSGKPVPQSKKRKSSSSSKQKKKRKSSSAKKPKKDKAEGEESEASDDDEDNDKEDEEAEDDADDKSAAEDDGDAQKSASDKDEDSDFKPSKKEPKPKKAKVEKKKDSPKKKTPKKSKSSKADKAEGDDADSSEEKDEDDEPLRPKKPQEPSNDDLKRDIKQLLEGANLEEITMKTVCKQIYDKYPLFDLTGRKEFIKATVKKLVQ